MAGFATFVHWVAVRAFEHWHEVACIVEVFDIAYFEASLLQKELMKRNLFFMV